MGTQGREPQNRTGMSVQVAEYTVLAHHWFHTFDEEYTCCVAAIEKHPDTKEWTAVVKFNLGLSPDSDLYGTAALGSKLNFSQAVAFFPKLDPSKCLNPG